jgi:hypothetical protein
MAKAELNYEFDVSAETLWALIGDFGDTSKWSGRPPETCKRDGTGVGDLRTLFLADGREIVDRLIDEGPLHYSYEIVESPLPVSSYRATMAVQPTGDQSCLFTWSGDIEPRGLTNEQATAFFEDVYRQGLSMMQRQLAHSGQ